MIPLRILTLYTFLTLGLDCYDVQANSPDLYGENVTVLLDEDKFLSGSSNRKTFHGGKCRMAITGKGNLFIERNVDLYGDEQYEVTWNSLASRFGTGSYYAKIDQEDGSLVIYKFLSEGDVVSWRTATYAIQPFYEAKSIIHKPFRLQIDGACVLRLIVTVENDEGDIVDREVWSNNRVYMTKLDIMQKGDILSGFIPSLCSDGSSGHVYCVQSITTHLRLQSDCNVVQKIGFDGFYFDESSIVWDSNSDKNGDPDCYIFNNGDFVGVFEGKWDDYDRETLYPERQGLIWRTPRKDEQGNVQDNWEETQLYGDKGFYPD